MAEAHTRRRSVGADHRERLLRPPKKNFRQKTRDFFWNPDDGTCLTRTPTNWSAVSLYYAIFLAAVFLVFYISMKIADAAVGKDTDRPQYILNDSPLGESPNVNFFPFVGTSNLIWLSSSRSYSKYVESIQNTFRKYKRANKGFNTTNFGACATPPFGYDTKTPCIFFRLNRLLFWKPTPYEKGEEYPEDMPKEVKDLIEGSSSPKVWLSCNGTTAKDRDHISQDFFQVMGAKGFDVSAFPYEKQKNYVDAIIPIQFTDKKPQKVVYSFTCTVWTREVDPSKVGVDVTYYFE